MLSSTEHYQAVHLIQPGNYPKFILKAKYLTNVVTDCTRLVIENQSQDKHYYLRFKIKACVQ